MLKNKNNKRGEHKKLSPPSLVNNRKIKKQNSGNG
jgi:hypothetical protein